MKCNRSALEYMINQGYTVVPISELFTYIKVYVDKHHEPGAFWLTGSQVFKLMRGGTGVLGWESGGAVIDLTVTGGDQRW